MPVIALLILLMSLLLIIVAYSIGFSKGKKEGICIESTKYKDKIKVQTKETVVD